LTRQLVITTDKPKTYCTPYASCAADVTIQMGPAAAHLVIDVTGYVGP
jgi:hypothetical protein